MKIRTKLILLSSIPLVVAMAFSCWIIKRQSDAVSDTRLLIPIHQSLQSVAKLVDCVQLERGTGSGFIAEGSESFALAFEERARNTDQAVALLQLDDVKDYPGFRSCYDDVLSSIRSLPDRRALVKSRSISVSEHTAAYSALIEDLLSLTGEAVALVRDAETIRNTIALRELLYAQEYAGRERSAVATGLGRKAFSPKLYDLWQELQSRQLSNLESALNYCTDQDVNEALREFMVGQSAPVVHQVRSAANELREGSIGTVSAKAWFDAATGRIDKLINIREGFAEGLMQQSQAELSAAIWAMTFQIGLLIGVTCIALGSCQYMGKRYFTKPLSNLVDLSREMASGNLETNIPEMPQDEIGEVGNSIVLVRQVLQRLHQEIQGHVRRAEAGKLDSKCDTHGFEGKFHELAQSVNELSDSLTRVDLEVSRVIRKVADGDLSDRIRGDYGGEFDAMKSAFNQALDRITTMLSKVKDTNRHANDASGRVEDQSNVITKHATEQSAALVEIASSLEEMTAMTIQSADSAESARDVANNTKIASERGATQVSELVEAIERIKSVGDEQTEILKTIDEIAFQTNLLALNAAVEAARAGEAGKGFAVVADEVRNLALRSAEAATTTARMTEQALSETSTGVALANGVSELLEEICTWAQRSSQCVGEIASASNEQAQGIGQISSAVASLDGALQDSSIKCQESSSEAGKMRLMIEDLNSMLSTFRFMESANGDQDSMGFIDIDRRDVVQVNDLSQSVGDRDPVSKVVASPALVSTRGEQLISFDEDDIQKF
ncbi:MAG: methyl-accepting chemotaxis protein [Planctomycetota bacterium]